MNKLQIPLGIVVLVIGLTCVGVSISAQPPETTSGATSSHLLDRGQTASAAPAAPTGGGTWPPTGPTTIFLPGGSPAAVPSPAGFGVHTGGGGHLFPPTQGSFLGNFFLPGAGYPSSFLTAGGVEGFDVTGVYAWHLASTPAASMIRVLGAAVAPPPPTPFADAGPIPPGGFASFVFSTGTPAPSGLLSAPGAIAPLQVTAGVSGLFCGLVVGSPNWALIGAGPAGNGLGGISGTAVPALRKAPYPFATGAVLEQKSARPGIYIAGCFADSSTTPVELMAFTVE